MTSVKDIMENLDSLNLKLEEGLSFQKGKKASAIGFIKRDIRSSHLRDATYIFKMIYFHFPPFSSLVKKKDEWKGKT